VPPAPKRARGDLGDLLSVAEVAALCDLSEWAVRRHIRAGDLPAVRPGARALRVRQADAEALRDTEGLMTVKDVATRLRVSADSVYRWTRDGKLGHVRLGAQYRFRPADLVRFLEANATGGACADGEGAA